MSDAETDEESDDYNTVPAAVATNVLEYIVESLVADPDSVEIDVDDGGRRMVLNVSVAKPDMGRVIGKRGRVAQAIRQVVRAAASQDGVEVDVEFVD